MAQKQGENQKFYQLVQSGGFIFKTLTFGVAKTVVNERRGHF